MIEIEGLTKRFGPFTAVADLSLTVAKGEVLGFLGPNGAGKSTTMKMVTGYLAPSAGRARICGHDIETDTLAAQAVLGYLPEGAPAYGDMTARQFLIFIAQVRGFKGVAARARATAAVEKTQLEDVLDQPIETLSKGYKRRVGLAQAILHDPPVLIMDEPTDGLDPNQKHEVRTLIREMGREKAIIFSTHILEEVEAACTRAIIIDRGKIVANGTPDELKARAPLAGTIVVGLRGITWKAIQPGLAELHFLGKSELISESNSRTMLRLQPNGDLLPEVLALAQRQKWRVEHLNVDEGRLDDVFRSITLPDTERASVE